MTDDKKMRDKKRRLRSCFDVLHSTMAMLWNECDGPDAKPILDEMNFHIFSRVRKLRVLLDVGYNAEEILNGTESDEYGDQANE